MEKSKRTLKSALDGILSYWIWYLNTAWWIFLGCLLMSIPFSFGACLGFVLAIRQIIGLFKHRSDLHIKQIYTEQDMFDYAAWAYQHAGNMQPSDITVQNWKSETQK